MAGRLAELDLQARKFRYRLTRWSRPIYSH